MSIVWAASLPQCLEREWSETLPQTTLRTEMDAGPAKTRRRFTTGVGRLNGSILLTRDQVPVLRTFYETDTEGGSLSFEWVHPLDHTARLFRFIEPPQIAYVSTRYSRASLSLEMLPIVE